VTSQLYFKLRDEYLGGQLSPEFHNTLHGLGSNAESEAYMPEFEGASSATEYYAPATTQQMYGEGYVESSYPMMDYYAVSATAGYGTNYPAEGELLEYM
jgi:hypothetical protein